MHLPNNSLLQGGKYEIVRFIGSGGFGCTYEAVHVMLQTRVAIKEFFVKDFCNRDANTAHVTVGVANKRELVDKLRSKFVKEARALNQMRHRHVVHVIDVFDENDTAYFVMDYVEGRSLEDMVKKDGAMPEKRAINYIHQICDALEYVHGFNRLHLDIKPSNILVDKNDRVVLIDFGTSKQYDEERGENTSTLSGMTPGYAPPEQMGNSVARFLPATDIYAVGATFYNLLTGVKPPSASLLASGSVELKPLPENISQSTRRAVAAAMQTKKGDRPQSIVEFRAMIDGGSAVEEDCTVVGAYSKPVENKRNNNKSEEKPKKFQIQKEKKENKTTENTPKSNKSKVRGGLYVGIGAFVVTVTLGVILFSSNKEENNVEQKAEIVENKIETVASMSYTNHLGTTFIYTGPVDEEQRPNGSGVGEYPPVGKDPGGKYSGNYVNGVRKGEGTFNTNDGKNTYIGSWENDVYKNGKLVFNADGTYYIGTFSNDGSAFYNGIWYDENGEKFCEYVDGKEKW